MTESEKAHWTVSISPDSQELGVSSSDGVRIATIHPHEDIALNAAIIGAAPIMYRRLAVVAQFLNDLAERETGLVQEIASALGQSLDTVMGQIEEGSAVTAALLKASPK